MEGTAARPEWNFMDFTHGSTLERPSAAVWVCGHGASALPALAGWSRVLSTRFSRAWQKIYESKANSICKRRFWMAAFQRPKRGLAGWQDQAWQGRQNHGHWRRKWSSYRLAHRSCFSPAEVTLVGATLASMHVDEKPFYVVADKAYDRDRLRKSMAKRT